MDINATDMTNKSWEVVCVIKFSQLLSKQLVSKIVSPVWWREVQKKCNVLCSSIIDAGTTLNDL